MAVATVLEIDRAVLLSAASGGRDRESQMAGNRASLLSIASVDTQNRPLMDT
jgi:hypothetical protein